MRVSQNYTFTVAANEQHCWNMCHLAFGHRYYYYFLTIYGFSVFILLVCLILIVWSLKNGFVAVFIIAIASSSRPNFVLLFLWTRCSSSFMYDRFRMKFEVGCLAPAHHMADVGCVDLVYQKKMKSFQTLEHQGVLRAVGGARRFTLCNGSFCSPFTWFDCSVIFSMRFLMPHM